MTSSELGAVSRPVLIFCIFYDRFTVKDRLLRNLQLIRFSQLLVACLDLCMDFHIAATSVLKPHQQNALSGSGQNDGPAGGDKIPLLDQSFEDSCQIVVGARLGEFF